jgi:hypothetical protein
LLRYFESIGWILEQQAPTHGLLHRTFDQHMRVTDSASGQASFGHMLIHGLKIQRSQCGQNSFTENGSDVPVQHAIILEGFRAYSRSYGCLKPSVKILIQRYFGPFQIAA